MYVLITEVIWDEGIKELEGYGLHVHYDPDLWKDRENLLQRIKNYDAVIVRNQTKVDQELLNEGEHLKVVGRLGVGLDNIDISATKEKDIKVVFARNANATSVAEYVMNVILSSNRQINLASQDVKRGNWDRKTHTGEEIFDKTIGLIGLGEIAHRVAKRANAFGMEVVGYDPFITEYDHIISETGVDRKESLSELLSSSDFISVHVPLNPTTKHFISTSEFEIMKPNVHLINTSRGGIIDESALINALRNHEIAGVYLDVLESEPIDFSNDLISFENAILSPHIAGLTNQSQVRTSLLVSKEVSKILQGSHSLCVV